MKVKDVLKLCSCKVNIFFKGQFVCEVENPTHLNDVEDWVLNSEVREIGNYEQDSIDIDSK